MQEYNCKVCGGELYWDADMGFSPNCGDPITSTDFK